MANHGAHTAVQDAVAVAAEAGFEHFPDPPNSFGGSYTAVYYGPW